MNVQVLQFIILCQCYPSSAYSTILCHLVIMIPISFLERIIFYNNESVSRNLVARSWYILNWRTPLKNESMMKDYLVQKGEKSRKVMNLDFDVSYILCRDTQELLENVGNIPGVVVAGWWPGWWWCIVILLLENPARLSMESGNSNYNYCTSFYSLGQNNVIPLKTYKITN